MNKITETEVKLLRGYSYGYARDEFHIEGSKYPSSALEVLGKVGFNDYEEFLQAFAVYLADCVREYRQPDFAYWCNGHCCLSLISELVHKCQKETAESLFSLVVIKLEKDAKEYKKQVLALVDCFWFSEDTKKNIKKSIKHLIKKKYG